MQNKRHLTLRTKRCLPSFARFSAQNQSKPAPLTRPSPRLADWSVFSSFSTKLGGSGLCEGIQAGVQEAQSSFFKGQSGSGFNPKREVPSCLLAFFEIFEVPKNHTSATGSGRQAAEPLSLFTARNSKSAKIPGVHARARRGRGELFKLFKNNGAPRVCASACAGIPLELRVLGLRDHGPSSQKHGGSQTAEVPPPGRAQTKHRNTPPPSCAGRTNLGGIRTRIRNAPPPRNHRTGLNSPPATRPPGRKHPPCASTSRPPEWRCSRHRTPAGCPLRFSTRFHSPRSRPRALPR